MGVLVSTDVLLQLYHPESIYVVLVGIELWTNGDLINVTVDDALKTLENFCTYRQYNINPYHNNDNAQLLTYVMCLALLLVAVTLRALRRSDDILFIYFIYCLPEIINVTITIASMRQDSDTNIIVLNTALKYKIQRKIHIVIPDICALCTRVILILETRTMALPGGRKSFEIGLAV